MKRIAAIIIVLTLFATVSSAAQAAGTATATTKATTSVQPTGSHVYVVSGNVFIAQGKNPAHRVTKNEPIGSDTLIQTGDGSSALLSFADGQVVTMQANSILQVREYRYDAKRIENSSIVFAMFQGGMRFITGLIGQHNRQAFRLLTQNATIWIHGTDFMVSIVGKSVYSQVLAGKITMMNAAGMKTVSTGQTVVVTSSAVLASLVSPLTVSAETFGKLQFIPIDPSAITTPVPAPAPEPAPASAVQAVPPAAAPAVATPGAQGLAGSAMADTGNNSGPDQTVAAASPKESPEPAKAVDTNPMDKNSRSDVAMNVKLGSLGLGAELNLGLTDSLGARIGLNSFTYKYNANLSTVNYDFKLQLQTGSALADWYPFKGSFRTSAGLMYNNNKVSLGGLPTGGNYDINGTTYSTAQIGSLQGTMSFNKLAPYFGIGWGNAVAKNKGWGLTSDIGVLLQGKPKIDLVVTCTDPLICTQLQKDAVAENTKMQNDLRHFQWWPVVSIGISYQW